MNIVRSLIWAEDIAWHIKLLLLIGMGASALLIAIVISGIFMGLLNLADLS